MWAGVACVSKMIDILGTCLVEAEDVSEQASIVHQEEAFVDKILFSLPFHCF